MGCRLEVKELRGFIAGAQGGEPAAGGQFTTLPPAGLPGLSALGTGTVGKAQLQPGLWGWEMSGLLPPQDPLEKSGRGRARAQAGSCRVLGPRAWSPIATTSRPHGTMGRAGNDCPSHRAS